MSPTVDVIVPVYGNWSVTAKCLDSLERQTVPHRVIVVDDCSPDDTIYQLQLNYPRVEVISLERNGGFAAACNRGIAAGTAEIAILVNNDVEAEPTTLERLADAFIDPTIGSAAPLLLQPNGSIDAFGITADVTMAGFLILHGADVARSSLIGYRLLGPYGAVAAYRRSALEAVGLLDQGIIMYGEELDLALRLSAAGWRPAAVAAARGTHLGGATAGRSSASQREKAGFGRGYILRAYSVLRSKYWLRALTTEVVVCLGDAILSRDFASLRGRLKGWKAGRHTYQRGRNIPDVDGSIGFIRSLKIRLGSR